MRNRTEYFVIHLAFLAFLLLLAALLAVQPTTSVSPKEKIAGFATLAVVAFVFGRRVWLGWKNRNDYEFFEKDRYVRR